MWLKAGARVSKIVRVFHCASFVAGASALPAQDPLSLHQCRACTIERRQLMVLDTLAYDGSYLSSSIRRVGNTYLVTSWSGKDARPPQLFDADGHLLREIGRIGAGPLEFRAAPLLVPTADSFLVFDPVLGRVTIVDRNWHLGRTIADATAARVWQAIALPNGRIIASGRVATPGSTGFDLHALDSSLRIVRSFGHHAGGATTFERPFRLALAGARDSGFWSAGGSAYRIEKWSRDLRLQRGLERKVPWFPESPSDVAADDPKPLPTVISVVEDEFGFLWVCSTIADDNWRSGLGVPFEAGGRRRYRVLDRNRYVDTMVEVFEARNFQLVASARFDEALIGVFEDGLTGSLLESPDGSPRFVIWSLQLKRTERR